MKAKLTPKHFEAIEHAKHDRERFHGGRHDGIAHSHDMCLLADVIDRQRHEITVANLVHTGLKV